MKKTNTNSIGENRRIRFVTATALFDGHDATINIIRRLLQQAGAEVIHLGHNRSAQEIAFTAIQEGVQAIAASSYQGGHLDFYKYIKDILDEQNAGFIKIFGGGGGVIAPDEIRELHEYGITRIYSPEDGQKLGLLGMIDDMIAHASEVAYPALPQDWQNMIKNQNSFIVTELMSIAEGDYSFNEHPLAKLRTEIKGLAQPTPVIGITGTGGSGKSSLEDEFIRRYLSFYPERTIAILAIDPTRKKTGGALLGDRIRMNLPKPDSVFMRSLATRDSQSELPLIIEDSLNILKAAGYDCIIIETPGIGQGNIGIIEHCDYSIYVMTPDYGSPTQLEKIDMLDYADMIIINKFDHKNALDALRDVRKQYRRNRNDFDTPDDALPIIGTVARNFNDPGLNVFFEQLLKSLKEKKLVDWKIPPMETYSLQEESRTAIIPPERENYLWEVAEMVNDYHQQSEKAAGQFKKIEALTIAGEELGKDTVIDIISKISADIDPAFPELITWWKNISDTYRNREMTHTIRDREIQTDLVSESLSGLDIPRVALPDYSSEADMVRWLRRENLPGYFPYTAGVFPFRRVGEDPKRQFAGEGPPERTNKRFHYLSKDDDAKRLSTAFDSLTLYGSDPSEQLDIFGKIGESGVSICTLDDMKKLYAGFDLCSPQTSVSMTINGPAPIVLALFFNTAIEQQLDIFRSENGREPEPEEYERIQDRVFQNLRGTVQSDILKEDQGQNSCIFSTGFALKMIGDVQEFFIENRIRNFYSISISGYHIAEAGANPVTQLAFTLANAFTYVEYFLSRGMKIDDFAPNLSFFFSTGMEPEYNVLIRVARRIWALAMKYRYNASEKSQRLKCHIQTSGRSLHAQDMNFNDIRTTLQALLSLNDNCNSLHTNSYDEAVTTPTEESVRRAMAIQLIIDREYGIFKNQNTLQGSFIIHQLTDMVEDAVLKEFRSISRRGGVLGAMESHYQRGKIQEESLRYERKKDSGDYPLIGVNTFINPHTLSDDYVRPETELRRATREEKQAQLDNLRSFQKRNQNQARAALDKLKEVALAEGNIFAELLHTTRLASLGQIKELLNEVGGVYRRNI